MLRRDKVEENKEYLKSVIGRNRRNEINWMDSIGKEIKYEYDWLDERFEDVLKIREYNPKTKKVYFEGYERGIGRDNLTRCQLGGVLGFRSSEYKYEIGYTRNYLIIIDRKSKEDEKGRIWKYYKYKCNECGHEDWIEEGNLKKGTGCNVCSGLKAEYGVNSILDETPWMIDLGVSIEDGKNYKPQSNKKIEVKCPNCGKTKKIAPSTIYKRHSIGCSCGDGISYPEKLIENLLVQLGIKYKCQYRADWSKNKIYDFYLPDYNTIIETHGEQHYKETTRGRSLKEEQENDKLKEELAFNNGIEHYIVINCSISDLQFIKLNVLDSELNELLDLNKIDWIKCGKYASSNLVKEVCDFYNQNTEIFSSDLAKEFNMDKSTIIKYLKQGTKLGWCEYDAKEELRRGSKLGAKRNSKPVLQFTLEGVKTYPSIAEASKQTGICRSSIAACCRGEQKTADGFIWKFAE